MSVDLGLVLIIFAYVLVDALLIVRSWVRRLGL